MEIQIKQQEAFLAALGAAKKAHDSYFHAALDKLRMGSPGTDVEFVKATDEVALRAALNHYTSSMNSRSHDIRTALDQAAEKSAEYKRKVAGQS